MAASAKKKKNRSKLGRGLSALVDQKAPAVISAIQSLPPEQKQINGDGLPGDNLSEVVMPQEVAEDGVVEIDVVQIVPNPHQPRRVFEEESLEELAQSIAQHGLMQPIVVRRVGSGAVDGGGCYELIAGERRWRATCRTGHPTIRALVLDVDDEQSAQLALIENIQREDLNAIERAKGFVLLNERFMMTQEQIAAKVGISRSSVANFLRLLELDERIQEMIVCNALGIGHGKVLLSCKDEILRLKLAQLAADELWTVRILESAIQSYKRQANSEGSGAKGSDMALEREGGGRIRSVLEDLEKRLGEQLSTRVRLQTDKKGTKGSITIEFYDLDHFDGLMARLGIHSDEDFIQNDG